ncbi:hypothetical protein SAMN07250955_105105 [Arboricoccus pini]|uniref:Uncharacterized protein n=1 Tax=Arboricoccus pini TaxID=1963835 RepID=A0A212R366_9PROT|nr:hypothetical protein SAMN07250955_105105 [Arboricoccus pini]
MKAEGSLRRRFCVAVFVVLSGCQLMTSEQTAPSAPAPVLSGNPQIPAPPPPKPRVITRTQVKTLVKAEKICPSKGPITLTQQDIASLSQSLMMQIDQHNQEGAAAGCW